MYLSMLCVAALIYVLTLLHYVKRGLCSVFHPFTIYAAFHGFVYVFRPFVAYYNDYTKIYRIYHFMPSVSDQVTVVVASTLGFLVFYAASTMSGRSPMLFKHDASRMMERVQLRPALNLAIVICAPLALYSLVHGLRAAGTGESTMIMTAQGYRINTSGNGYTTEAMLMLVPICALFAWLHRFRWYSVLPILTYFVLKASTGGRGPFVATAAITGLFYFYDKRIKLPGVRLMIGLALLGGVFSAIGADRGYALRQALGLNTAAETHTADTGPKERFLEGMDFASKEYFEFVVNVVPARSGTYDYFLSNLQLLTEPIPRFLWSGKPVGPPVSLFDWWDYGNPIGISVTLPGAGWFELGWLGVVIWCGLWGWVLGRLYQKFVTGSQSTLSVAVYLVSLAMMVLAYRDGALLTVAKSSLWYMGPILVVWLARRYVFAIPSLGKIQQTMLYGAAWQRAAPAGGAPYGSAAASTAPSAG